MGTEIGQSTFSDDVRADFRDRLRNETKILKGWFDKRRFTYDESFTGGLEVEAWLVDKDSLPAARNGDFLATLHHPLVVAELSQFNFEINTEPLDIRANFLSRAERSLRDIWRECRECAASLGLAPMTVGVLPTVRDDMLQLETMSASNRYAALTAELFRLRNDKPVQIDIRGREELELTCRHLMLEAACTSLQVHLRINQEEAKRFYNASQIISGPLVACAANSPYLYGRSLWAESRVPAFEQATDVLGFRDRHGRNMRRVTLGSDYLRHSFLELFLENLDGYPVLLPALSDAAPEALAHLRLQNGTVWRWNRPIIGFDGAGRPHLRIEQRVMPAGPTLTDMIANMGLYLGLALALAKAETPPEENLPFETCRSNFYACARDGLAARVTWLDGREVEVQALLRDSLLPAAKSALEREGLDAVDLDYYFGEVLARRLLTGRNGAAWQRNFVHVNGPDFQALTERYLRLQESGEPVHTWTC